MGVFSNLVYTKVSTLVSNAISSTGPLSTTVQALSKFKNYLESSVARKINVLTGFVSDSDMLADDLLEAVEVNVDEAHKGLMDINIARLLHEALYESSANGRMFMTDASGYSYLLKVPLNFPTTGAILSTLEIPTQDYFTWSDLVTLIIKANNPSDSYSFTDIHDGIKYAANTYYGGAVADDDTYLEACEALGQPAGSTIRAMLWDALIHIDGYMDVLPLIERPVIVREDATRITVDNMITTAGGLKALLFDVIQDQVESASIDEMLLEFTRLASNGVASEAAIVDTANKYVSSKFTSVANSARNIKQAYLTGGLYGLAKAILQFASAGSTIHEDDGIFKLSDNSKLVPKEYIAGIVASAVAVLGTVASIIASVFNQVVGFALSALSSIITGIINNVNYDYSQTLGSVCDGADVLLPISPHAGAYGTCSKANAPDFMTEILDAGYPCGAIRVIGGYVLFGPASYDDDGVPASYNWEFHPSLDDPTDCLWMLGSKFGATSGWSRDGTYPEAYLTEYLGGGITYGELVSVIQDHWTELCETKVWTNDDSGYLSETNDNLLVRCLIMNTALFQAYLGALDGLKIHGDTLITGSTAGYIGSSGIYLNEAVQGSVFKCPMWTEAGRVLECLQNKNDAVTNLSWLTFAILMSGWSFQNTGAVIAVASETGPSGLDWSKLSLMLAALRNANGSGILHPDALNGLAYLSIADNTVCNELISFSSLTSYAVKVPQYNRSTFWGYVALGAIASAAVVVGAIVATVATVSKITEVQAKNQAKVYAAHDALVKNPTTENYKTFKSARLRNNAFSRLTGGTVFSKVSVWEASSAKTNHAKTGSIFSKFLGEDEVASIYSIDDSAGLDLSDVITNINEVKTLIDGVAR